MIKKININNKKKLIALIILILGIIICFTSFFFKEKTNFNNDNSNSSNIQEEPLKLKGRDRVYAQEETINLIKEYLKDISIYEYAKTNELHIISLFELSNEFNINIDKFNSLKYKCNNQNTTFNFNEDYTEYYINLDCLAFYD